MDDLSVTVTADTEEFVESIEEATEALNKFQEALDELEDRGVTISIGESKEQRIARAKTGLANSLEEHEVDR